MDKWDDLASMNVCFAMVFSKDLPTEELAELHAIIQAIEYERAHRTETRADECE